MKRIIFCFDGTWNKLRPDLATNVVLTAASIERIDKAGIPQIIHYAEGVGTGDLDQLRGGMFGEGLIRKVRDAYAFLVFNYDPGDEIYVFGFSRGAFAARTFIGFLRHVGPLRRLHVGRIDEALNLYEERKKGKAGSDDAMRRFRADFSGAVCIGVDDDGWRCSNDPGYATGSAPLLTVRYLGVWDTVSALGVPENIPFSAWINRSHDFNDPSLDAFVESARHAVALDERREAFPPVLLGDLTELNRAKGHPVDDPKAAYQEKWFPGVHGSVGGGGDIRGLSDGALAWILDGAKAAGLRLDTSVGTRIHGFRPDPYAPLVNEADPSWSATEIIKKERDGPDHLWQVSSSAVRRWRTSAAALGGALYRPESLNKVKVALDALGPFEFVAPTDLITTEKVKMGDSLRAYALKYYGNADKSTEIEDANLDVIDNPDDIIPGQLIRIPALVESPKKG